MTHRYIPDSDISAILDRAWKLVKGELYEV